VALHLISLIAARFLQLFIFQFSPTNSLYTSINLTDCSLTSTSSVTSLDSETEIDNDCTTEGPSTADFDSAITVNCIQQYLEEQQVAWEDVSSTGAVLSLDPPKPIDHQMICDIQAIAGRLASKARQLLGKYSVLAKINNDIVCWVHQAEKGRERKAKK